MGIENPVYAADHVTTLDLSLPLMGIENEPAIITTRRETALITPHGDRKHALGIENPLSQRQTCRFVAFVAVPDNCTIPRKIPFTPIFALEPRASRGFLLRRWVSQTSDQFFPCQLSAC